MALLLCPDCGKKYSSKLDACPECHSPAAGASEVRSSSDGTGGRREMHGFDLSGATRKGWLEGMVFKNKYELVKRLGRGAQTEAWKAKDLEASDDERAVHVVLKLLPQDISGSNVELLRIRKNFQKVHDLVHQRIASYRAFEQDGDDCMVVMELAPGVTLGEYRLEYEEKHGEFPVPEAVRICRQIAEGLDYARSRQVAHRDIKPDNIMVTPEGNVKILDFGLAAEIRSSMSRVSNRQLYDSSGTNLYKAPEQWRGLPPQYGTDQYALAVVFHELLSGSPPFVSDDPGILGNCALNNPPQPLPMLSEAQNRALLKALAKDPAERFETCMAFIDAVAERVESSAPVVVKPAVAAPVPKMRQDISSEHEEKMERWAREVSKKLFGRTLTIDEIWAIDKGSPLMPVAAGQGRVDVMEWLKEKGADVNAKNTSGDTPMHMAAWRDNIAAMEWLKSNGARVNAKNNDGNTPMHNAAINCFAAMAWLGTNGGDINSKNSDGRTPLDYASNYPDIREWLNQHGGKSGKDIGHANKLRKLFSFFKSILSSIFSFLKQVFKRTLDLIPEVFKTISTIYCSTIFGIISMIAMVFLIAFFAYIVFTTSPMHHAAVLGDVSTMELLKENGADVNSKDGFGQTPLDYAHKQAKADAEKWLRENGGKSGEEL